MNFNIETLRQLGTSFDIVPTNYVFPKFDLVQFRFPKSKKRRIRDKFRKDGKNYRIVEIEQMMVVGNIIYVNYKSFENLKNKFKQL